MARLVRKLVSGSGVATFFFGSWVIQVLFNHIVVGYLGLLKPLSYWQAAELWFLFILATAWTGFNVRRPLFRFFGFDIDETYGIEVGSFFLAAWIFQLLFNGLVVRYFGLFKPLNYLQAAGLLLILTLLLSWAGLAGASQGSTNLSWSKSWLKDRFRRFLEE